MSKTDYELAKKIRSQLLGLGIETPMDGSYIQKELCDVEDPVRDKYQKDAVQSFLTQVMGALGLDVSDDSLNGTPKRIARMYVNEIFYGLDYKNFPECTTVENKMNYDEVIISNKCEVLSMCEHHFVPFIGHAYIGYIPKTKILGLSKFNRIVDFFARRPQIQERLTEQIAATLKVILETDDIAVIVRAQHLCVKLRGVKDGSTTTITSKMDGRFRSKDGLRAEFLSLISKGE